MTRYAEPHRPWHDELPLECDCDEAYAGRGMVDPHCQFHQATEWVTYLRDMGWIVLPPPQKESREDSQ